jgi:hypothetical protein
MSHSFMDILDIHRSDSTPSTRIVAALLLAPSTLHVGAEESRLFRIGPLALQFPARWRMQGDAGRMEGRGPHE